MTSGHIHVRIDNRLLHGQVVQFWLGHLEIVQLIIADDNVAGNEAMPTIYRMAVPQSVDLSVLEVSELCNELEKLKNNSVPTLVIVSDVFDIMRAIMCGARFEQITIGNVHSASDRMRVTDSVYLSVEEQNALANLHKDGIKVEIQTFPGESLPLKLDEKGTVHW